MNNKREAGILMPIASLPSDSGVGGFGKEARWFIDTIAEMGVRVWQILPLNPLGYGNSPYQPYSSYAGDDLYIDLNVLAEEGLVGERVPFFQKNASKIEYAEVRKYRMQYLYEAFDTFKDRRDTDMLYKEFISYQWVKNFCVFMALKKQNQFRCWNEWPKEEQDWIIDHKYDLSHLQDEIEFQYFLQYMFWKQWNSLKKYANDKGIQIMGDIPIYVGLDSADVWENRRYFMLDADGRPTLVAGVPPDMFTEQGQRWGNPIYNWEEIKKDDFIFWVNRLKYSKKLYDILRIDHFRAFDTYWSIPAECETAVTGEWVEAPGYELLDKVYQEIPDIEMVVEDLGDLRPEVLELRDHYCLAGMDIVPFSLGQSGISNQVIYTGTHDNQTVNGWFYGLSKKEKQRVKRELNSYGSLWDSIPEKMIAFLLSRKADLAIISIVDLLELDDTARLNTPGTVGSPNWEWMMDDEAELLKRVDKMQKYIRKAKRNLSL